MSRKIPGFIWDPNTQRYYRDLSHREPNAHLNNRDLSQRISTSKPIVDENNFAQFSKRVDNLLKLLKNREYGEKNFQLQSDFFQLRLKSLNLDQTVLSLNHYNPKVEICFLKGGKESIFGLWNSKGNSQFIAEVIDTDPPFDVGIIQSTRNCVDFCDGFNRFKCFMSISNDFSKGIGKVKVLYNIPSGAPRSSVERRAGHTRIHELNTTLYSCTCNVFRKRFAIGCENTIVIEGDDRFIESKSIKGNIHSVQFNDKGNTLFCGKNSGELSIWDLRAPRCSINKKLFGIGIDETLLLTNQFYLICGTFDGSLYKFDVRNLEKITEFKGHVHSVKKVPFSYYEETDILCATGLDNVTRLWSYTGGYPFKCVTPPDKTRPHRAWITDTGRFFLIQGKEKYYYDIYKQFKHC